MVERRRRITTLVVALGRAAGGSLVLAVIYALGKRAAEEAERRRMHAAAIAWSFILSFAASVVLATTYALGGQPQIEGAMLFVALGGVAVGLVLWSSRLMPNETAVESRHILLDEPEEREEAEASFVAGTEEIGRRKFLGGLLGAAVAALGAAFLFPIRSFGKAPGTSLYTTSWRGGFRAVQPDGSPVVAATLVDNEVVTIFPEGHLDAADSVAILIKMPAGSFTPKPGRESWSPQNILAFSKICTHAGCPVGLYQAESAELLCPCHQSVFLVSDAAKPISGPATRPLPQLPLSVDADGYVVAQSDFLAPIGPEFWHIGKSR